MGGSARNLVVCLDGTGNAYGEANTNVVKWYSMLDREHQLAHYDPGVGTFHAQGAWTRSSKWLTRMMGLGFGFGLAQVVSQAYRFLQQHWQAGDAVYIVGFSRGAYTARVLAGFLHKVGLLHAPLHDLVPYAYDIYRKEHRREIVHGFRHAFARPCPVRFVGVWDTVSAIGWVWNPRWLPYTHENPDVQVFRHAMAIDERRAFYRSNRWKPSPGQDAIEAWFAGVHCDVGGSYPESESGLAQVALRWMVEQARGAGLRFDDAAVARHLPAPDALAAAHDSLRGAWWLMEASPKWIRDPAANYRRRLHVNLARRRFMREGDALHASVPLRMQVRDYRPPNLPERWTIVS